MKSREENAEKLAVEKEKSIKIRERYDKNNELRRNGEVVEVVDPEFAAIDNIIIACVDEERAAKKKRQQIRGLKTLKAVTFTLKETGDVVGIHQLIFGGKTIRCEPTIARVLTQGRESSRVHE